MRSLARSDATSTLQTYRPSPSKVVALLQAKLTQLEQPDVFGRATSTLGRQLSKAIEADATKEEKATARRSIALDTILGYLNQEWRQLLSDHLNSAEGVVKEVIQDGTAG